MSNHPPFYGKEIDIEQEKQTLNRLLKPYVHATYSEELKEKIYALLVEAKSEGLITIPFKVITRTDGRGIHRPYIEVLLDTKV